MTESPEAVLAKHRAEAVVLRSRGLTNRADDIERLCSDLETALAAYLSWLGEAEASLWSGRSRVWLRRHRETWRANGDARRVGRTWMYRQSVLPRRADLTRAEARGHRLMEAA